MAKARRRLDPASTKRVPKNQINPTETSKKMGRTADFSGVGDYTPIAGGQYEIEAQSYEWKDPKNENGKSAIDPDTNKPYQYASMKWAVTQETDDAGNDVEGHVVYNTYSKNPKSLFMLKRDAISLGEDPELFDTGTEPDGTVDLDKLLGAMIGRKGLATLVEESYTKPDGTVRNSNKISKIEALELPTAISAARR